MHSRLRKLAFGVVVVQIADVLASAIPQMSTAARLDHLGLPHALRSILPTIKVSASLGLLVGLRWAPVGTMASAGLVAFYSSAVGFHRLAGDHAADAVPAATLGIASTLCFFEYLSHSSRGGGSSSRLYADVS
jgi:DoxX-like family